jgi:ferritin-like metal-binding protein YciE
LPFSKGADELQKSLVFANLAALLSRIQTLRSHQVLSPIFSEIDPILDASMSHATWSLPRIHARDTTEKPMSELETIKDLLEEEIQDLYSAEKQLTKAIPKMAKGSNNEELSAAFEAHLKETEGQIERLEQAAELLDIKTSGKKCKGMEGVIAEGAEALEEEGDEHVLDLGIIGAGSRVEHYEMAGYTTAINLAKKLGNDEVVNLLTQNLEEEQAADEKLRTIGDQILEQAPTEQNESEEGEESEDGAESTPKRKAAGGHS